MKKQKDGEVAYYKLTPAERDIITDHITRNMKTVYAKAQTPEELRAAKLMSQIFMRLHRLHPDPLKSLFGKTYYALELTTAERRQLVKELVASRLNGKNALDLIVKLADPKNQHYRQPEDDVKQVESMVKRF